MRTSSLTDKELDMVDRKAGRKLTPARTLKTAVVTGGASGIGQCTVDRLLREGWKVWALDVSKQSLAAQAARMGAAGDYTGLHCDVAAPNSVKKALNAVSKEVAQLDALICCAGVLRVASLEDHSPDDVDLTLGVIVKGPWLCVREALPLLRKRGNVADPARVVIVGSIAAMRPKVGTGFYAAAKSALHTIAGISAVELGPSGITVNTVAPGTVDTPMVRGTVSADPKSGYKPSGASPLGRIAQPDDVTDAIMYFLGDLSKYVNGAVLPVDGGTRAAFLKT
jgi:NAD(P)-dependent dehydrogenase (short-subunit alcohol dehydrogenase family)